MGISRTDCDYMYPTVVLIKNQKNEWANSDKNISAQFKSLGLQLKSFIKQHKVWLLLLFIYPIGFTTVFGILNPLLVDAKWSLVDIGFATKVFGSIVGIISAFLATILINKLRRKNALIFLTILQGVTLLLFIPLTLGYYTSKPSRLSCYFWIFHCQSRD